ncbi:MAG: DUF1491 family protein [Rhodospirillales bacterium]|jgi:hypothetical protein
MRDRIRTQIWVQAQIRVCDQRNIAIFVRKKGDVDAGAVLIKLNGFAEGSIVLTQVTGADRTEWMRGTGDAPVSDHEAEEYIERQLKWDPDVWVLEIEDPKGEYLEQFGVV